MDSGLARLVQKRTGMHYSRTASDAASPLIFLLATPIYKRARGSKGVPGDEKFAGVLTFVLNVEEFLNRQMGSRRPRIGLDQIWPRDKEGNSPLSARPPRYDPQERETKRKGLHFLPPFFQLSSGDVGKKEGVIEYQVRGEPRKIAGFAPVPFGELSWIVVVTSPADHLTAFVWRSLRDHLFLLAIVLAMLTTGSYLIIREERTKTKAEEEILRWQEKTAERMKAQVALQESESQLRRLSHQLLNAQETERRRISSELHDELGQALTVMKLHINYIKNRLEKEQVDVLTECKDALDYIDQVIENVRRLSRDLSPAILEDFGLSAAIRWLADNFAKRHGIRVSFDMFDLDSFIPPSSHTVAYRIVQEALTNIAKHAHADNIAITASVEKERSAFVSQTMGKASILMRPSRGYPARKGWVLPQ